jgi:hypothetical protein
MRKDMKKRLHILTIVLCAGWAMSSCQDLTDPVNNMPTVATSSVSNVSIHRVYATGCKSGGKSSDECYFLVSTSQDLSNAQKFVSDYSSYSNDVPVKGAYLENLQPATTYYYAFCASDGRTDIRGDIKSFKTSNILSINSVKLISWEDNDSVNVSSDYDIGTFVVYSNSSLLCRGTSNKEISRSGDSCSWKYPVEISPDSTNLKVYAYSPYTILAYNQSRVPAYVGTNDTDYLYGSSDEVTSNNPAAVITMHHALSRIIFSITSSSNNNTNDVFSRVSLQDNTHSQSIPVSGYLDLISGNFYGLTMRNNSGRSVSSFIPDTKTPTNIELLTIPMSFQENKIVFELHTSDPNHYVYAILPASSWKAGYQYVYSMEVDEAKAQINGVQVQPWKNNDSGSITINN